MRYLSIGLLCLLSACGTPPEMTRQATNTAALVGELQRSMRDFERQQRLASETTLRAIAQVERDVAEVTLLTEGDATLRGAVGDAATLQVESALTTVANVAAMRWAHDASLSARLAQIASAVQPVPSSWEALMSVQRSALLMTQELSPKERLQEQLRFIRTVRDGVRANRAAMEAAARAADAAAVPTP